MELGFIRDMTYGGQLVSQWAKGPPIKSFWQGTKIVPKDQLVSIGTYRCTGCGFLESYARDEFVAQ
jgi:hypothetical protein